MKTTLLIVLVVLAVAGCGSEQERVSGGNGGRAAGGAAATAGAGGAAEPEPVPGTGGVAAGGVGTGGVGTGGVGTGGVGTGGLVNVAAGQTGANAGSGTIGVAGMSSARSANMATARTKHTATLLPNGKVLVMGGSTTSPTNGSATPSAELYDPVTGTISPAGSMTQARLSHTATLLKDGTVLVTGAPGSNTAELYDPATSTFSPVGNMAAERREHTATLLDDGKVLVAGGFAGSSGLSSAELYDPVTRTFTATGNLTEVRYQHAAVLLRSNTVLLVGGYAPIIGTGNNEGLASAEVYDPSSGTFAKTGTMGMNRVMPTATLLTNGTVLVAGGPHGFEGYFATSSLELYNPGSATFATTGSLKDARTCHTATLLLSGEVLFAGGYQGGGAFWKFLASTDLYSPASGTCAAGPVMAAEREYHTATRLADGSVLILGGDSYGKALSSAELYRP